MRALLITASFYALIAVTLQSKISDEFFQVSETCIEREQVPQRYRPQLQTFQYANEPVIHKYIYCVATLLHIWDDTNGFNIEKIYQQYRTRANDEVVLPVISNCNQNTKQSNRELWSYRAFICILDTQVGEWFKADVVKRQQQQQQQQQQQPLLNGH